MPSFSGLDFCKSRFGETTCDFFTELVRRGHIVIKVCFG